MFLFVASFLIFLIPEIYKVHKFLVNFLEPLEGFILKTKPFHKTVYRGTLYFLFTVNFRKAYILFFPVPGSLKIL